MKALLDTLAPLYRVARRSWLAPQLRQERLSALGLRRLGFGAYEIKRLTRLGILEPLADLAGARSLTFPVLDAAEMIRNPQTVLASLEAFTQGDTRPGVLVALERRKLREAAKAVSQPLAGDDALICTRCNLPLEQCQCDCIRCGKPCAECECGVDPESDDRRQTDDQGGDLNPEVNTTDPEGGHPATGDAAPAMDEPQSEASLDGAQVDAGQGDSDSTDTSSTGAAAPQSRPRSKRNAK